jgi:tetratricopeptide (TPR) repeat protein
MSSGTDANDPDKKKPMTEVCPCTHPAYTRALTTPPAQVDVMTEKIYGNMSAAHVKLGNWKRAEETADACLKKNPDNTKALFRKAKALGEQGFYERAEPLLQDLLKKSPAEAPSINAELKRLAAMDREREKAARQKLKGTLCIWAEILVVDPETPGWMSRDKGEKTESKADEETTPAGPPPVSSATIEEVA